MLCYYKIKELRENSVVVVKIQTKTWKCQWDETLEFNRVGVRMFDKYDDRFITLEKSKLMGKGTLLPTGLLVPFYWDMLYS